MPTNQNHHDTRLCGGEVFKEIHEEIANEYHGDCATPGVCCKVTLVLLCDADLVDWSDPLPSSLRVRTPIPKP